jgi:hypothetical protein
MPKKKKGVKRLPSSDLLSQKDGWVEAQTHLKTRDLPYVLAFDPGPLTRKDASIEEQEEALASTYRVLARLILDWDWKDSDGDLYPKPKGNEDVFGDLRPSEFNWLIDAINKIIAEQATIPKAKSID